jgi:hypothetical protein
MTPTERYARNFAKVAYHSDSLDVLDDTDRRQIARIFDTFRDEYHAAVAEYPLWVAQPKNLTPRDRRRVNEYQRRGEWPIFLFSQSRIAAYLHRYLESQNGAD